MAIFWWCGHFILYFILFLFITVEKSFLHKQKAYEILGLEKTGKEKKRLLSDPKVRKSVFSSDHRQAGPSRPGTWPHAVSDTKYHEAGRGKSWLVAGTRRAARATCLPPGVTDHVGPTPRHVPRHSVRWAPTPQSRARTYVLPFHVASPPPPPWPSPGPSPKSPAPGPLQPS